MDPAMSIESAVFFAVFGTGAVIVIAMRAMQRSSGRRDPSQREHRDSGESYSHYSGVVPSGGGDCDSGGDDCSTSDSGGWDSSGCDAGGGGDSGGGGDGGGGGD
jgi:hypothetical protein